MQTKTLLATVDYEAGSMHYNFPFLYLRKEFVKILYIHADGTRTPLVYHDDYDVAGSNIMLAVAGNSEDTIRIYRETPTEQIIADYVDASILKAYDLNIRDIQLLHILEESMDFINLYALLLDPADNAWDALSKRLKNLADPTEEQDAATKHYSDEEDEKIMTFIRRFCLLLDEEKNKWEGRSKGIMKIADPVDSDDAATKNYVDTQISNLRSSLQEAINAVDAKADSAVSTANDAKQTANDAKTAALAAQASADAAATDAATAAAMAATAAQAAQAAQQIAQAAGSGLSEEELTALKNSIVAELEGAGSISQEDLEQLKQDILSEIPTPDVDEIRDAVLDSIRTPIALPYLVDVYYNENALNNPGMGVHDMALFNAQFAYDYDGCTVSGDTSANAAGTYYATFTPKPLYCWQDDRSQRPITIEWIADSAEAQAQKFTCNQYVATYYDGSTKNVSQEYPITGNAIFSCIFRGGTHKNYVVAPKKVFSLTVKNQFTTLHFAKLNADGETWTELETGTEHTFEQDGLPVLKVSATTQQYSQMVSLSIEATYNTQTPITVKVWTDDDQNHYFAVEATGENFAAIKRSCEPPTLTLQSAFDTTEETPTAYYGHDIVYDISTPSDGEVELTGFATDLYPVTITNSTDGNGHEITTYAAHGMIPEFGPEYIVDHTAKTLTIHLTTNGVLAGNTHYPTTSQVASNPAIRTKDTENYHASNAQSLSYQLGTGAYAFFKDVVLDDDGDASYGAQAGDRWYTGSQVTAQTAYNGCTISGDKQTAIGTYTITATKTVNKPWADGSTSGFKELTWRVTQKKPCQSFIMNSRKIAGLGSKNPFIFKNKEAGVPKPTFTFSKPGILQVTEYNDWNGSGWVRGSDISYIFVLEQIAEVEDRVTVTVHFEATATTGEYNFVRTVEVHDKAHTDAIVMLDSQSKRTFSRKLSAGAQEKQVFLIQNAEMDWDTATTPITLTVEDTTIATATFTLPAYAWTDNVKHYPVEADGTLHEMRVTVTPRSVGSTNFTITIPETAHYGAVTRSGVITVTSG